MTFCRITDECSVVCFIHLQDLRNLEGKLGQEESAHSLNAIFGFLFGELKDTKMVRRWVVRKMNVELEELLQTKTAGRVLEQITVRGTFISNQHPDISNILTSIK